MKKIMILGGGITGISIANLLKSRGIDSIIYEKENEAGGLCRSFYINNFSFDYGAHCSFTKNENVKKFLEENVECTKNRSESLNYKKGKWLKNPVQNNLYRLETEEKICVITDYIKKKDISTYNNYEEWLIAKYGDYFAKNYPMLYTKKYWTVDAKELETEWVGPRMYVPTIEEILKGAFEDKTPNIHYAGEIRYPQKGGFSQFLQHLLKNVKIEYNKEVVGIDDVCKQVQFADGEKQNYDILISTLPLDIMGKVCINTPENVEKSANELAHTSMALISLGLKKELPPYQTCYIYDEDIYTVRIFSTSQYSKGSAPKGCSTLQMEVYFSRFKEKKESLEEIKKKVIREGIELKIYEEEDILFSDIRWIEYANVIFTKGIYESRKCVQDYLENIGVIYAGRFADWDYMWTDQCIESAQRAVNVIMERIK